MDEPDTPSCHSSAPPRASQESQALFKAVFSDSNNIILWHESEDMNKKSLFPKF